MLNDLASIDKSLPSELGDPTSLAQTLQTATASFKWVRKNTVLTPYYGRLKGARGVLIDRMGNSLDRSLLLANLLSEYGHKVRLARAHLSSDIAKDILSDTENSIAPDTWAPHGSIPNILKPLVGDFVPKEKIYETQKIVMEMGDQAFDRMETLVTAITKEVDPVAGGTPQTRLDSVRNNHVEILRDHWWLQVSKGTKWIDFDVIFDEIGHSLGRPSEIIPVNKIPAEMDHQLKIAVIIESTDSRGHSLRKTVMNERFSSKTLLGQPLHLTFQPLDAPTNDAIIKAGKNPELFLKTSAEIAQWLPTLEIGSTQIHDRLFYSDGETLKAGAFLNTFKLGTGINRVQQNVADNFTSLFESLEVTEEPLPRPHQRELTAVWLRLNVITPYEKPTTQWRAIYDAFDRPQSLEPALGNVVPVMSTMEKAERTLALASEIRFLYEPTRTNFAWFIKQVAARIEPAKDALLSMFSKPELEVVALQDSARALNRVDLDLLSIAAMRWSLNYGSDALFHNRAFVAISQRGISVAGSDINSFKLTNHHDIDIIDNRVGVRPSLTHDPFLSRLEQGISDTVAESAIFPPTEHLVNVATMHAGDLSRLSSNWALFKSVESLPKNVPTNAAPHILNDFQSGNIILAPELSTDIDINNFGWWRINPNSGDTLGILESGRGGVSAETLQVLLRVGIIFACFNSAAADIAHSSVRQDPDGMSISESVGLSAATGMKMLLCATGAGFTLFGVLGRELIVINFGLAISLASTMAFEWVPIP